MNGSGEVRLGASHGCRRTTPGVAGSSTASAVSSRGLPYAVAFAVLSAASTLACRSRHEPEGAQPPSSAQPPGSVAAQHGDAANPAAAGRVGVGDEWPMATGDHANTRFSQLADIHTGN